MQPDEEEFLTFTTPDRDGWISKVLLVTVQFLPGGNSRIVAVHSVTKTTITMLERTGAPHFPEPSEQVWQAICDFRAERGRIAVKKMDDHMRAMRAMMAKTHLRLVPASERRVQ